MTKIGAGECDAVFALTFFLPTLVQGFSNYWSRPIWCREM